MDDIRRKEKSEWNRKMRQTKRMKVKTNSFREGDVQFERRSGGEPGKDGAITKLDNRRNWGSRASDIGF